MTKPALIRRVLIVVSLLGLPLALGYYYMLSALDFPYFMLVSALSLGLAVANLLDHRSVVRNRSHYRVEQAREAIEAGHLVQARNHLDEVDKLDRRCFEARVARGELFRAEQNFDKARHQLLEALELQPNSYRAHYALAVAYLQEKKIYEAVSEFNTTIRLKADYAEAYYMLAQASELTGENEKALSNYRHFLKLADEQSGQTSRVIKLVKVAGERIKSL